MSKHLGAEGEGEKAETRSSLRLALMQKTRGVEVQNDLRDMCFSVILFLMQSSSALSFYRNLCFLFIAGPKRRAPGDYEPCEYTR